MLNPCSTSTKALLNCVVIIGYVWPEPNSSAAGSRMMQLLNFFKKNSQRVVFASPALHSVHRENLPSLGIEEHSITLNCDSFDTWLKDIAPDAVIFDRFMMEEQFGWRVEQHCPDCIRILNTEDLHSLRNAREQRLKNAIKAGSDFDHHFNNLSALYQTMAQTDICQREIAAIMRSDLSIMISSFEIEFLKEIFKVPEHILMHLPFMLERPASNSEQLSFDERKHFVTIGNFRHQPNWDCVRYLKMTLWPLIRKALPQAQLHIYGAYPAKKVTDLHNPKQGFYIQGWAEDAHQVLANAKVCLAPIRFGAGIKGKFTDAMQNATPIVTTPIGSEAMHENYDWPGAQHLDSQTLADSAVSLFTDAQQWQTASDKGQIIIDKLYNKNKLEEHLHHVISQLKNNLQQSRLENFCGSMLRHHHHKSTQYMSQWIAAKNSH
jgi:glycosyltransferase involved in cell wall biosynthesis